MRNVELSQLARFEKEMLPSVHLTLRRSKKWYVVAGLIALLGVPLGLGSARFLVVNQPRHADVILVLAGDNRVRPIRALQLASEGYADRILLNVPEWSEFYDRSELDIAQDWAKKQAFPVTVCPTHGLSTKDEARDTQRCLSAAQAHTVLIVTSDFHTRRALATLRRELPEYDFAIAATFVPTEFGVNWWEHREWAKTNFYEWTRLAWWELVDRWF